MIKTLNLSPGVTLRCFPDSRFKQGCLSLQFIRPMDRQEAALNALIPAVLLRGCTSAPDLRHITLRLDDLYGASVGALVRHVGDYQTMGMYCGFISDQFAMKGDQILAPVVEFLGQLLTEPVTRDGVFRADYIESEKKNLISTIESELNNKRAYANARLLRLMCREDAFGIPRLGDKEAVKAITPKTAFDHYRKVLRESPVELFYVGREDPAQVAALLKPLFEGMERSPITLPAQTAFTPLGVGDHQETMEVAQAKLCMGFATPINLRTPQFGAMQVCNTVFGAGMTSKLFMNVRERMSLCYAIHSGYYGTKGILTVSAGIDSEQEQVVRREVLRQLQAICDGDITEAELLSAKQALCSSLRGIHDSAGAVENYYGTGILSGQSMTPAEYIACVESVTAQQVAEAARTLVLDTVFVLKGVQ